MNIYLEENDNLKKELEKNNCKIDDKNGDYDIAFYNGNNNYEAVDLFSCNFGEEDLLNFQTSSYKYDEILIEFFNNVKSDYYIFTVGVQWYICTIELNDAEDNLNRSAIFINYVVDEGSVSQLFFLIKNNSIFNEETLTNESKCNILQNNLLLL